MDKGNDTEEIHKLVRDTLNSYSLIRLETENVNKSTGIIENELLSFSTMKNTIRETKVETVFSVLKRKFGESLKARKYRHQVKEIKIKVIPL